MAGKPYAPLKIADHQNNSINLTNLNINLWKLHNLTQDNFSIIRWLVSYKFLKNNQNCQHCNIKMSFQKHALNFVDGFCGTCMQRHQQSILK